MNSQAHAEMSLTPRKIAARQQAVQIKAVNAAAKVWLAGRKNSATPIADRLIARKVAKNINEASARPPGNI